MKSERSVAQLLADAKSAKRKGETARAIEIYETILERFPKNRNAKAGLDALTQPSDRYDKRLSAVLATYKLGHYEDALNAVDGYLSQFPKHSEALSIKVACLRMLDRPDEALEICQAQLDQDSTNPSLWDRTGTLLVDMLRLGEAEKCFQMATRLAPDMIEAWRHLAHCYQRRGDQPSAYEALTQALGRDPNHVDALDQLGQILRDMGHTDLALDAHKKALDAAQSGAEKAKVLANIGVVQSAIGETSAARDSYAAALEAQKTNVHALMNLVSLSDAKDSAPLVQKAQKILSLPHLSEHERSQLNFALFRLIDRQGKDPSRAFDHLRKANAIRRRLVRHSPAFQDSLFDSLKIIADHTPVVTGTSDGARPIFIVGLPRSGTTLTEQMLSAAPNVHPGGEMTTGERICNALFRIMNTEKRVAPTEAEMQRISTELRQAMTAIAHNQPVILDKMPLNFRWVGLLLSALPDAKVINIHRDPIETCWSNYTTSYSTNGNGFVYDLTDLVHYHRLYIDLTDFWAQRYPTRYRKVSYEDLVANTETTMRGLVDYAELDWDDGCLHPERVDRAVMTASSHQVRKAVYNGNQGKWRPYAPFIGELLDEFGAANAA